MLNPDNDFPTRKARQHKRRPRLERSVGVLVIAIVIVVTCGLVDLVASFPVTSQSTAEALSIGWGVVFYSASGPVLWFAIVAVLAAQIAAAIVGLLELRSDRRTARSTDELTAPLAPRILIARGATTGETARVTVLMPAHNEAVSLPSTIASVAAQSHAPERIVVVADNCTDETVDIALAAGVEVFESRGNTHKKAGALNQALAALLPTMESNEIVMVMDADTVLERTLIESAVDAFLADRSLVAVGAIFRGEEGHGLIGQFQRNEYTRYGREIKRRRGRVFVLTGTASLFRAFALRTVAEQRGNLLPGAPGQVYDTESLTEDNELTIAVKTLGGAMVSPTGAGVVTELMPAWGALYQQRLRWQRGALENIGAYGLVGQTVRYWAQQLGIGYSVISLSAMFALICVQGAAQQVWVWFPFWLITGAFFAVERVVTAWPGGWRARLLAVLVLPELAYDLFLCAVFVKGIADMTFRRQAKWTHVERSTPVVESIRAEA